jgi:hypothetical protein
MKNDVVVGPVPASPRCAEGDPAGEGLVEEVGSLHEDLGVHVIEKTLNQL